MPIVSFSQEKQLDLGQRWSMNEQLMDLIEMYERYAGMERNSDVYSFSSLFRSDTVPVWCDYIASNEFGNNLPVSEYVKYSRELEYRAVKVKNLKKGDYKFINGRWHVPVEFDKQFKYEDSQFLFSTLYPELGGDFHIVIDCVWIEEDNCFRIAGITGAENPGSTVPKGRFKIVQQKNEIDRNLLYKGKPISFNEDGFVIVPDTKGIEFRDDDVKIKTKQKPGEGRYDIVSFSLVPTRMRKRTHFSFYPSGIYKVKVTTENDIIPSSTGWEIGAEIGYALSLGKSTKFVVYAGYAQSFSNIMLSAGNIDYQYGLSGVSGSVYDDVSGSTYDRKYHLDKATERLSLSDAVISLCGSLEQNFGKRFTIVGDTGIKLYLNSKASLGAYTVEGTVTDQSATHRLPTTIERVLFANPDIYRQWALSWFVKGGPEFAIIPGMYVYAKAGIEFGLNESFVPFKGYKWLENRNDGTGGVYPFVLIEDRETAVRSLSGSIQEFRRNGWFVEGGLRLKFGFKK